MTRTHTVMITGRVDEHGLWCGECLLPSAVKISTTMISEQGALDLSTFVACACGMRQVQRDWV